MPALLGSADERKVISVVTAINGGLAVAAVSLLAWLSDLPLVFPALGPTAFILFGTPFAPSAAPRSVVMGHLTGMACGYGVWQVVGLFTGSPVSMQAGGLPLFVCGSLALALTCSLLVWFSLPHPPACASALVVALGGVTELFGLSVMAIAVVLITAQAVAVNRICCLPVPIWRPRDRADVT